MFTLNSYSELLPTRRIPCSFTQFSFIFFFLLYISSKVKRKFKYAIKIPLCSKRFLTVKDNSMEVHKHFLSTAENYPVKQIIPLCSNYFLQETVCLFKGETLLQYASNSLFIKNSQDRQNTVKLIARLCTVQGLLCKVSINQLCHINPFPMIRKISTAKFLKLFLKKNIINLELLFYIYSKYKNLQVEFMIYPLGKKIWKSTPSSR